METQGWPLYAARKDGGIVYAVIGWENRSAAGGRRAIGVELRTELDGAPAVQLGDAMSFFPDAGSARMCAAGAP